MFYVNKNCKVFFYDNCFNFLFKDKRERMAPLNLISLFKKDTLEQIKKYAIKLSEDFPNFIRVDLYVFHDEIYFSELTFASYSGQYMNREEKFVKDCMKNFSRVSADDYY